MRKIWYMIAISLAWVSLSCSTATRSVTYQTPDQTFTLEGPLFMGPNTAQISFAPDLKGALGEANSSMEALKQVKLTQATFRTTDSLTFADLGVQGIVFQMVTDAADMVQVAVVNPIEGNVSEVDLTVSSEAEIGDLFKGESIYLLADFDLAEDIDSTLTFEGSFTFDLQVAE